MKPITRGAAARPDDESSFREHRTREQLNALLHYGHSIPVSRGWTDSYVHEHFPGWTWNALMDVFRAAGIVVPSGGSPPKCDDRVKSFHFDGPSSFLVVRLDGARTRARSSSRADLPGR